VAAGFLVGGGFFASRSICSIILAARGPLMTVSDFGLLAMHVPHIIIHEVAPGGEALG
jgi:hypothetical protein